MAGTQRRRGRTPQKQSGGGSTPLGCIGGILQTLITAILAPVAPWIMMAVGIVLALDVVITRVKPLRALLGSMPITRALFAPILPWVIGAGVILAISWLLRNGPALLEKWEPYLSRGGRGGRSEEDNWARGDDGDEGGGWGDKPPAVRPGARARPQPQAEPRERRQRTRPAPRQAEPRERRQRTRP